MRLVTMVETPANVYGMTKKKRDAYEAEHRIQVQINVERIGVIRDRGDYVTLSVDGEYIHVAHSLQWVLDQTGPWEVYEDSRPEPGSLLDRLRAEGEKGP